MPRTDRTVLIDGYQPTKKPSASAAGKVLSDPSKYSVQSTRTLAGSALTQKLPKTTSSVNIPKK